MNKNLYNDFGLWIEQYGNENYGHVSAKSSISLYGLTKPSWDKKNRTTLLKKINSYNTEKEPKHISIYKNNLFVTCMSGKSIMHFVIKDNKLILKNILKTRYQCVHSIAFKNYLFFTESDLKKNTKKKDFLCIYDFKTKKIIKKIYTYGKWSKYIKILPKKNLLFITNWFSNSISVFNIKKIANPTLVQTFNCGISPRGIDFNSKGTKGYVTCYYSRNIIEFTIYKKGINVTWIGPPYDYPNYSGNFRDITILNNYAFVSNMGRNLLLKFDIKLKKFVDSIIIGKFPNSIIKTKNKIIVSCALSNLIYIIGTKKLKILGISEKTLPYPIGLAKYKNLIISASFYKNKIELWKFVRHYPTNQNNPIAKSVVKT